MDSTTVAHHAVKNLRAGADYPCFTLGPSAGDAEGFEDDLPYARLVSGRLGAPLDVVRMAGDDLEDLDGLVWSLDEPTPDPAAFATRAICAAARARGVKVLLSGAGGMTSSPVIAATKPWRRNVTGAGCRGLGARPWST